MVGHTGDIDAAVKAVETVDSAVGQAEAVSATGAAMLVADHGNCEVMWDPTANSPHTAHTTNPCRAFWLIISRIVRHRSCRMEAY